MELKLDELLHSLHRYQFADAEQIVAELRHFILDQSHKEAELAFISSKIFNSQESLLQFLRQNSQMNERILSTVKKRIYELIMEYIKHRKQEVSGYLQQIKDTCMVSFLSDSNSLVRESSLQVLCKLIESYKETESVIQPEKLVIKLLDEIKLRNPAATVKGGIWQLVGLLHANYHKQVGVHIIESQDVQYQMLLEQVKSAKPEIKAIIGMLKGFTYSFKVESTLEVEQIKNLYIVLKTLMSPIQDMKQNGVIKAAMRLLSEHANLFTDQIMKQAMDLIGRTLQLCTQENLEVRDAANDLLGSLIRLVSDNIDRNKDADIRLFKNIMTQFDAILESNDFKNMQLLSAIRAVGIFSKAIQVILGDNKLWEYLNKLTELSEQKLIKEFMDQDKPESDLQNFKQILKKQKQLIAYIESYSFIIRNLNSEPSEKFRLHFMRVGGIGVNNHRKLYLKYRSRFYESLAQLTMSLSNFENGYQSWIKMFVRFSLTETLKIPDSVIYGGESPADSLEDAVTFWKEYIGKDQIWTEVHCRKLYDQLIDTCLKDIVDLDLSYKVERTEVNRSEKAKEENVDLDMQHNYSYVEYIANNSNDQQYMIRLTNFLELFIPASYDQWLLKFVPEMCRILVRKATTAPRIPKLYVLLKVVLETCSKYKYFETSRSEDSMQVDQSNNELQHLEDLAKSDKTNTYNMLLTFLKDLIGKSEEFQDELLDCSLSLLLKVPIAIIHQNDSNTDNLYLWKGVMIKALGLSQLNNKLALTCINTLESWFNALPVSLVAELYSDVLPKLSTFLQIDPLKEQQESYFFQGLIKDTKEVKIDRREIANKVIDLLGKIGGHAHQIINNELTKSHDKENFIRWDSEKRLKFTIPLNQRKIDIYLDSCLPRIIDIAKNSIEKETRIGACELLHGLILYMIGKSATKPSNNHRNEQQKISQAAFAKLYAKLFPVIIKLATEVEEEPRKLFQSLIFQIVRWFSSSKVDENAEVESLFDALIEGSQSRNNSALREICCNAVAVFAQWTLKHSNDEEIKNIPVNIKSLLRRIESNSNHPDPFRRLSSVLCFGKILQVIKDFDPLVDIFCLEITRNVLSSLKQCHNSLEFSQDVIDNCSALLDVCLRLIVSKMSILVKENPKRAVHTSLAQFQDFLFVRFTAVETVYRRESMKLWEGLAAPQGKQAISKIILTKYVPRPDERPLWNLSLIKFETRTDNVNLRIESKKQQYLERQTQMDTLSAQIEFLAWTVKKAQFKYSELNSKLKIDLKVVKTNIQNYFVNRVDPCFKKLVKEQSLQKLLACKENREQLTKSNIRLLTQLFQLIRILQDYEISDFITQSNSSAGGNDEYLFDLALQIVLIPSAHRLNLLVQDYELESALRKPCEDYIERIVARIEQEQLNQIETKDKQQGAGQFLYERLQKLIGQFPLIDLERLVQKNQIDTSIGQVPTLLHPRVLSSLLTGYIKLARLSPMVRNYLLEFCEKLGPTVEIWIKSDTPTYIESSRLLVDFMASLRIPNETLNNWLKDKSFVYQKTSDLLLKYISENWTKDKVHLGEYLIQKATKDLGLLAVFLPIIEFTKEKPSLKDVLIRQIPQNWQSVDYETEFAEKQVQIYYNIVVHFKESFEKQSTKEQVTFISFVLQQSRNFLASVKHNIYFKRQVLRLVGFLYSLKLSEAHISVHTRMKSSLETFLNSQLPIVSREIASNKNEIMNYEQLIHGYLDLLDLAKSSQVLHLLFRVIREHKPKYLAERIKQSLNNFIAAVINDKDTDFRQFQDYFDQFLNQFFDQSHTNPDDNLRWAIANKILNRILETCSKQRLQEIFLHIFRARLRPSLERDFAALNQFELYNAVREKTHVILMLEIFVRRFDMSKEMELQREEMMQQTGEDMKLIQYMMIKANEALYEEFGLFDKRCSEVQDKIQLPELNSTSHVVRRYACAGYTLLSSAIVFTQKRQKIYEDYLFDNWENIIDVKNEELYQFDIMTNFNTISLESFERKYLKPRSDVNNQSKSKNYLKEYMTTSFMQTNQKFDSALVFETQQDPQPEKDKVKPNQPTQEEDEDMYDEANDHAEESASRLELDYVNKHECMKNIKRVLDKMQELFVKDWKSDNLPRFMQQLLMKVNGNAHQNVKIFILKLLVNNPDLFKQYAEHWLEPICNFIVGKQKNGKGLHYFHRDLVTLLISWKGLYSVNQEKSGILSKLINTLIRIAADKQKHIFSINIEILAMLIREWKAYIVIEKEQLVKMLNVPDQNDASHLWKMTAIQVVALACTYNVPLRNSNDVNTSQNHEFKFIESANASQMDPLLEALLKCQSMTKKQLIFASSEALGLVLKNQPAQAAFIMPFVMQNDVKEKHDVIVNVIERLTREFPALLTQRRIFMKLLSYINTLTGSMRSAVLIGLTRYFTICSDQDRKEITDTVKAISEDVLSDTSEDNQLSFLKFIYQGIQTDKKAVAEILEKIADRMKPVFINSKNEGIRGLYYDLMIYLYNHSDELNFKAVAKSSLIRGLSDSSKQIQQRMLEFWNEPTRLSNDPVQRMEQLLTVLYDQEEESIWLNNSGLLLMEVSRLSDDFKRKIFEESLRNCKFQPLIIGYYPEASGRSQPLASIVGNYLAQSTQQAIEIFNRQKQMQTAKVTSINTIPEVHSNEDVEMIESQSQGLPLAGQNSLPSDGQDRQRVNQIQLGQIRSTQVDYAQPFYKLNERIQSSLFSLGSQPLDMDGGRDKIDPAQAILNQTGRQKFSAYRDTDLGSLMKGNNLEYNVVNNNDGKIRIQADGSQKPGNLARQEDEKVKNDKLVEKTLRNMRMNQVNLIRTYRDGEIPDIQIPYSDLLLPLMLLIKRDSTIATEVLVELFTQIYKESNEDVRKKLGDGIKGILQQSIKFDYGIINTAHRISIELQKIDGFLLDPEVIERTGRPSMSFQTSLLLLEESLLPNNDTTQIQRAQKTKIEQLKTEQNAGIQSNKAAWFSLIQLYELVGNEDALKGIWCSIGSRPEVMIKKDENATTSVPESISLIKQAQVMRATGNTKKGLKLLEQVLSSEQFERIFEEQVQLELMNKKYESLSELSKWDNIGNLSLQHHQGKQLYDIPFFQAETMIRAQLRCPDQWGALLNEVESWQQDPLSRVYLDKRFNYEQAMLHITSGDFDRARFYISKESNDLLLQWKDLTKLSQVAQHFLVQKIQKIYETKDFLHTTKQLSMQNFDDLAPQALQQIQNWVHRQPNYSFDKLNVWDDILASRMLFLDQYKLSFKNNSDFNNQLEGRVPSHFKDIQNISAILYTQNAKGALRMGLLDSSHEYLLKALDSRSSGDQKDNLRIVVPIIKLNIEYIKQQATVENWQFEQKFQKFSLLISTIDAKIKKDQSISDTGIHIKGTVLKLEIHKKLLSFITNDFKVAIKAPGELNQQYIKLRQSQINDQVTLAFNTHQRIQDLIELGSDQTKQQTRAKSLFHFSKLCDKLLRDSEEDKFETTQSDKTQKLIDNAFKTAGYKREEIVKLCIRNTFTSINLGYLRARTMIPRLLDLVSQQDQTEIDREFTTASKDTPAWIFIRWIGQLSSLINKQKSEVIDEKITQICKKYPQAMFYPFNVLQSNIRIQILDESLNTTPLFRKTQKYFEDKFRNLYSWTQALEGLVNPEKRFSSWLSLIKDAAQDLQTPQNRNRGRIDLLLKLMIEDIGSLSKQYIGEELGDLNRKFAAEEWVKPLTALQGKDPQTILRTLQIREQKLQQEIQEGKRLLLAGEKSLSYFSEYLVNLDNNDFYNPEVYIEIPGQYDNQNQEPILDKNVKIASIKKSLLILSSIQRPKRITVHGSNEKDFNLLIKGGEDLRLDQRIQQIFHIVNSIFKEDSNCQSRSLNLKTFGIVPTTNNLGILEWIDNTEPIKLMIDREHQRRKGGKSLQENAAQKAYVDWLNKEAGQDQSLAQKIIETLSYDSEKITTAFTRHKQMLEWSLLRNGLENLCLTSSAFITIKNQFVKSIAVFSIVSYLLGIGDRHLENFLVNTTDGEVLGIDFGCSFGAGIQLCIPELVPFRLTQQIEGVIAPHTNDGIYKQTMIHVLNAVRKKKNIILDTCDIFVKEPLLDWVKKAQEMQRQNSDQVVGRQGQAMGQTSAQKISFYPKDKIETLKQKLNGRNPVQQMIEELNDSQHKKRAYKEHLVKALKGPEGSTRVALNNRPNSQYLTVEEQVESLIEMARDPNILGRAWIGWGAFI